MTTINEIRETVAPLVKNYPVRRVILFGSYARGDETMSSDVDLIIDSEGQLNGFDFFGIVGTIVKAMPVKVDVFELGEIKKPSKMFDAIMNEGQVIYEA
jgi:predicted nucleotidyltransferase